MPAAVLVQFCCGSVYAWSVFNAPIDKAITGDEKASQAPVTFYINIGVLGFASAFMGPWIGIVILTYDVCDACHNFETEFE